MIGLNPLPKGKCFRNVIIGWKKMSFMDEYHLSRWIEALNTTQFFFSGGYDPLHLKQFRSFIIKGEGALDYDYDKGLDFDNTTSTNNST